MSGETSIVTAGSATEWRAWLARNGQTATEVWLVLHHRGSGIPGPRYHEAVEQALCFGWIDSLHRRHGTALGRTGAVEVHGLRQHERR